MLIHVSSKYVIWILNNGKVYEVYLCPKKKPKGQCRSYSGVGAERTLYRVLSNKWAIKKMKKEGLFT